MHVTVYTDASYLPKKKEGSYAYSLVSDVWRKEKSGKIPMHLAYKSIHFCEMFALAAGVLAASKIPGVKSISVKTDSLTCVKFFYGKPPHCKDNLIGIAMKLIKDMELLGIKLIVSHVKGHQRNTNKQAIMNNSVHKLAKKSLLHDQRI